jgi:hypothetical protein
MATPAVPASVLELFRFPNPVNETAARVVAGGAALMAGTFAVGDVRWLIVPLSYGFVARVAAGPRFSPLGQLATRVIAPRLPAKLVPGPPKRFAQAMGTALSLGAAAALVVGQPTAARVLVGGIAVAATLESVLALCLGCRIFAVLMELGVIPPEVCEACNRLDLGAR